MVCSTPLTKILVILLPFCSTYSAFTFEFNSFCRLVSNCSLVTELFFKIAVNVI